MRIKVSKIVPKGYAGITLWPFGIFFSDKKYFKRKRTMNHEKIHWEQQRELLGIFFYLIYGIEFLVKFITVKLIQGNSPYRNLAAEREAYKNDDNLEYLKTRKRYNWLKYIIKKA